MLKSLDMTGTSLKRFRLSRGRDSSFESRMRTRDSIPEEVKGKLLS
jgi:hypothetical protein